MSTTPAERIARLEVQMLNLEQDVKAFLATQKDMDAKLDLVVSKIERYESKLGGVILAVSAIMTFVYTVGGPVWETIKVWLHLSPP